jgi:hypothetical protein
MRASVFISSPGLSARSLGDSHGLLLAYAAIAGGLLPFGATRGFGASRPLRPHRYSRGEPLHLRDTASRVLAAIGWQPVQRLLVAAAQAISSRIDLLRTIARWRGLVTQKLGTDSHCVTDQSSQSPPALASPAWGYYAGSQGGGVRRHGRTPLQIQRSSVGSVIVRRIVTLDIEVIDDRDIVVSHPESGFSVTYRKNGHEPMLIAIDGVDRVTDASEAQFLAQAWKAAHRKARELGWLKS